MSTAAIKTAAIWKGDDNELQAKDHIQLRLQTQIHPQILHKIFTKLQVDIGVEGYSSGRKELR